MEAALNFNYTDDVEATEMLKSIHAGESTWDDYTFEQKAYKGWFWPYMLQIDELVGSKRWNYWFRTILNGELFDEPIPQIKFLGHADPEPMKNLRNCLEHHHCLMHSVGHSEFFDWLLWGFGEGNEKPRISEKVNELWYRTFNLGPFIQKPHDYLGEIISEAKAGKTYWTNPNAFFPTPHHIVDFMTQMSFTDAPEDKDQHTMSVCDPCVGSGRFLMYASNYSLNLYGVDIDPICVKACKLNGYFYVPWLVKPVNFFDGPPSGIVQGNSLKMGLSTNAEKVSPTEKTRTIERKPIMPRLIRDDNDSD